MQLIEDLGEINKAWKSIVFIRYQLYEYQW
jgi:hypothetical protein